jgi:cellobiose-specific phosphotransferase system component IIA
MPRAAPSHVSDAGAGTVAISAPQLAEIVALLVDRDLPPDRVLRFAEAVNPAVVYAYELDPRLSTAGESASWHRAALRAIKQRDYRNLRELLNQSTDEFDGRYSLECELLADTGARGAAIEALRTYSEGELASARRSRRRKTKRQMLADSLIEAWRVQFDDYPVYWIEVDALPPFLHVLKTVLFVAEAHYIPGRKRPTDDALENLLRNLTSSAIQADRRRVQREEQALRS